MTPLPGAWPDWDLMLRGAVAGLLVLHTVLLALPGPRPAVRAALAMFSLSLIGYLFCQRGELVVALPAPLGLAALALCTSGTVWLWLAARGLFDDGFTFSVPLLAAALAMPALGVAANLPYLEAARAGAPEPEASLLLRLHMLAMLLASGAALWEVARGWRDDLVAPRRLARRWVALGIGGYALVALVVELALRGRPIGMLLPALHVLGIGSVALAVAVLIARHSLAAILGMPEGPQEPAPATGEALLRDAPPASAEPLAPGPEVAVAVPAPAAPPERIARALARLSEAMTVQQLYRREGLTLAALADALGLGEAALRSLINQQLGYRNFNDFLHHYRLQEAAARLTREELPVLSIALGCGYGSIGPFNRAFKQRYGLTPTDYRATARVAQQRGTNQPD